MKYLIDIGHPAHVHLFRNFAAEMTGMGHEVLFTCREKEYEIELLSHYGCNYRSFGKKYSKSLGKIWGMVEFGIKEYLTGLKFKPDFLLSHGSPYAAQAAFLLRKPHISFEDTFNNEQIRLYKPFTKAILTSTYPHPDLGPANYHYPGYHELAYLHPSRFKADPEIRKTLGVEEGKKYFILRFVSWEASHDIGHNGISFSNKLVLAEQLEKYGKVFITSEKTLPAELEKYRIQIPPHRMHDAIAFSSLLYGESATMASEAAMLGIPAIYLDDNGRPYTNEQEEKYGLVFNYSESEEDQKASINKATELANSPEILKDWARRRDRMLMEKIDVTAFLVWFVLNWPESARMLNEKKESFFKRFMMKEE
jgi:predicted glycosyltransferase